MSCARAGPDGALPAGTGRQTPPGPLRYVPLAEFELWRYLMETPPPAARWSSRRSRSGCPRRPPAGTRVERPDELWSRSARALRAAGRARPAGARSSASSRRRPIPRRRRRSCGTSRPPAACVTATPGYFVPAAARVERPPRPDAAAPRAAACVLIPRRRRGAKAEGQILRTALALAAVTGQRFEIVTIRARRPRARPAPAAPGRRARGRARLRRARSAAPSTARPTCASSPAPIGAGDFSFEIATAGAATPRPADGAAAAGHRAGPSRVEVTGGTHVPASPGFHYLARPLGGGRRRAWASRCGFELVRAGFSPPGGGEIHAPRSRPGRVRPALRPRGARRAASRCAASRARDASEGDVGAAAGATRPRSGSGRPAGWSRRGRSWRCPSASPGSFLLSRRCSSRARGRLRLPGRAGRAGRGPGRPRRAHAAASSWTARAPSIRISPTSSRCRWPSAAGGGRVTTDGDPAPRRPWPRSCRSSASPRTTWGRGGGPGGLEVAGTLRIMRAWWTTSRPRARLLLWDFARGSLAYDAAVPAPRPARAAHAARRGSAIRWSARP